MFVKGYPQYVIKEILQLFSRKHVRTAATWKRSLFREKLKEEYLAEVGQCDKYRIDQLERKQTVAINVSLLVPEVHKTKFGMYV